MREQDSRQVAALQLPTTSDPEAWKAYWETQSQPWRTEPEIDAKRQKELDDRRKIVPDIKQSIYPFKGMKLNRADVEWLLAMHENGRGPVIWSDESQRGREGLDMRGTDLRQVDLSHLPLTRIRGGLIWDKQFAPTEEQRNVAAVLMDGAYLSGAQLEGACLSRARLEGANLEGAHLEGADFEYAHLEGADLLGAHLEGVRFCRTFFDVATRLNDITISDEQHGSASIGDVSWNGVNLTVVDWSSVKMLGYERQAHQRETSGGESKNSTTRLLEYKQAVRANRQLAVVLRDQGLNEEADHFAYHAQLLQREVWRLQRRPLKFVLSWFLYLLAGYGYRPLRSVIIYLLVVVSFAIGYYEVTHFLHAQPYPLAWYEALILSISSFHGRGFFQPVQSLGDPVAVLASIEAIFGLLIEISFIATFTQRFFGR
jgi:uncharacterized protein YjbI with pentapeptide repeats